MCLVLPFSGMVDRRSPLGSVPPGLSVHTTQNVAPKLGLANGCTGKVVGTQVPQNTIFKSTPFQECTMRLFSKHLGTISGSVYQSRFRNRFLGVPEGFPENTVPIVPFSLIENIMGFPNRKLSVKATRRCL